MPNLFLSYQVFFSLYMYNFAYYNFNKCNVPPFNRDPIHRFKHRIETADLEERTRALYVFLVFGLGTPTVFWVKTARDIYYRVWRWRHDQATMLDCTFVVGKVGPFHPSLYVRWLSNILAIIRVIFWLIALLNVGLVLVLCDFCGIMDSFTF
jgi:hypothetical protein